MLHYQHYTVEDLALDVQFRHWVNNPTPQQDIMWEQWLKEFPDKCRVVEQARIVVLSLHTVEPIEIDEAQIKYQIDQILVRTEDLSVIPEKTIRLAQTKSLSRFFLKIAASVALLSGIGLFGYWKYNTPVDHLSGLQKAVPAETKNQLVEHINSGTQPMLVNLPDKSTILLQPKSRVYYSRIFEGTTREVHLAGEAFFEVAKNPQKPFYVYTDEVVTKVLGTSFHIKANPSDSRISVIVKTGSVSVFTKAVQEQTLKTDIPNLVLTPNQQIIYQRNNKQMIQSVLKPLEIKSLSIPDKNFVFNHTPVTKVLSMLEENYHVDIQYSETQLHHCDITASFTDEPFAIKLDLICGAIGVSYQMEGNQVVIQGTGCVQ